MKPSARYHYMDSLRGVLMVAGVFYHSAAVYATKINWRVKDPAALPVFDWLCASLTSFRMPLFFFIAGFFCHLTFRKRDHDENLKLRLRAFLLPFFSIALLLQPLQYWIKLRTDRTPIESVAGFITSFYSSGEYVSHLWFLVNLCFYYVAIWLLLRLRARWKGDLDWLRRLVSHRLFAFKSVLAVVALAGYVLVFVPLNHAPFLSGISLTLIAKQFPFFFIGFLAFGNRDFFENVMRFHPLDVAGIAAVVAVSGWLSGRPGGLGYVASTLLYYEKGLVIGYVVLRIFVHFFDRRNETLARISDASYTIYLFHQILVVSLSLWLLHALPPGHQLGKYVFVVTATSGLTYLLHRQVIRRFHLTRLLFNGKP